MKIPISTVAVVSSLALITLGAQNAQALEATWDYSVQVSAQVESSPPRITLAWPQDTSATPTSYTIYRKALEAPAWGNPIILPGTVLSYTDSSVSVGSAYEYQVIKTTPLYTGSGYIYAGIKAPLIEDRGKLILLVDNTHAADLRAELARLEQDLVGDGWQVLRHDVGRDDSVVNIKTLIQNDYFADPAKVKAVFLFGHVPVPDSGNLVPDGHYPDHQGAWAADVYYGDMDGSWTDTSVNNTAANDDRNHNIPGDGKFDQSDIPSSVELEVGRVDLAKLPGRKYWGGPATFPSELELLRNYLNKDHAWRHKQLTAPARALIYDDFGVRGGEAFAASAYRNFAPLVGPENITTLTNQSEWLATLANNNYLWAYACGAGSYTSIGGIGNTGQYKDGTTIELVQSDIKAVFTLVMGSWLGDWDSEDNFMRSILASRTEGLASAWSGRPHWFCQHMGLGLNIGYSARLTQNNGKNGLYTTYANSAAGQVHIALMGDPTLRMQAVAPPSNLNATPVAPGVRLTWGASPDSVLGYYVYRATTPGGPFARISGSLVTGNSYTDSSVSSGSYAYMVRAVKLETSASGSYYNPSQGLVATTSAGPSISYLPTGAPTAPVVKTAAALPALTPTGLVSESATNTFTWVDDALPTGAVGLTDGDDAWTWITANPAPFSGTRSHQSSLKTGRHEHLFNWAWYPMTVNTGEYLFGYVFLDPANPPSEVMLQWCDGNWEHRAYWGANNINYGMNGTQGRRYMGPLPPLGQWVRLEVPAAQVGLEGRPVKGMSFALYNGRAAWDVNGKANGPVISTPPDPGETNVVTTPPETNSTPANPGGFDTVSWVDDALPTGATGLSNGDSWNWISSNPTPFSGAKAHLSSLKAGLHEHFFNWAWDTLTINTGETMFAYVYLDPNHLPSELMLHWNNGNWEHRAYWGANKITYGTDGTPGRRYMGPLPAAGKWTRLEVPAQQVNLEGSTLKGMTFSLYDGQATWDLAGKLVPTFTPPTNNPPVVTNPPPPVVTNPPPPVVTNTPPSTNEAVIPFNTTDYVNLQLPKPGDNSLAVITPTVLELKLINTKQPDPARVSSWDFIDSSFQFHGPSARDLTVLVAGNTVSVNAIGFRRRPLYAPLAVRDLRIENSLYLKLANPIADGQRVEVKNPAANLWPSSKTFITTADPLRYNPAIHVNQEGYVPSFPKKAMIGYYLGNLGELTVDASAGFRLIESSTGAAVFQGALKPRPDSGYTYTPAPYTKVLEADFSAFTTPGEYRLQVPGLGASLPFLVRDGIALGFARAFALGLYHQRCGTNNELPYTRHVHGPCHTALADVPSPQSAFPFTWNCIASKNADYASNPRHTAPRLKDEASQRYPFVNKGKIDVSGGHHDAGDYSKYTINSTRLVHYLMFAVDAFPGVADLDNLGLPESGDGISDIMQEAKWEADFVAKMQDADGGFYFLVYPRDREYEGNVTPDQGDPQVVWPKTTAVTAAGVAALAQCASSPRFKAQYPQEAALYLQKAQLGWKFLTNAIARYGKDGSYQKITHYGDEFMHDDELAWAACEMFLATGNESYHQTLKAWFDPASPDTWRWGWWRLPESYGSAIRSYAFAARSGRLAANQLDPTYLAKCETQILLCAQEEMDRSHKNAYGSSFPLESKSYRVAGWYFSSERAFDLTVGYQLDPRPEFLEAMVANFNYEGGCNPVNVSYITGLGWKRQREIVHQYAQNDRRVLPPSGLPLGNIQDGFSYIDTYKSELGALCFPQDYSATAPYPFYNRWADTFNVTTEFVVTDQARSLADLAFVATLTPAKSQAWKPVLGQIIAPTNGMINTPRTATLEVPGMDLNEARIVWEARDQEPAYGASYTFTPTNYGAQWIEAEAQWPDGRRVVAVSDAFANNNLPVVSVTATGPNASETGQVPGVFTFTRTGSTAAALTVNFQFSGTATKWNDYRRPEGDMPESVVIPAGAASATLTIIPVVDNIAEGAETVILTISPNPAYNLNQSKSAIITIRD